MRVVTYVYSPVLHTAAKNVRKFLLMTTVTRLTWKKIVTLGHRGPINRNISQAHLVANEYTRKPSTWWIFLDLYNTFRHSTSGVIIH